MTTNTNSIRIPEGTIIVTPDFCTCKCVENVYIPRTVAVFEHSSFLNSTVKNVYFEGTLEEWMSIDIRNYEASPCVSGANLYINGELVEHLTVDEHRFDVRPFAFAGCKSLKSVTIPYGVETIGECAFAGCSNLEKVEIENGLKEVRAEAFFLCENLSNASLPESVEYIGRCAFGRTVVDKAVLPEGCFCHKNAW